MPGQAIYTGQTLKLESSEGVLTVQVTGVVYEPGARGQTIKTRLIAPQRLAERYHHPGLDWRGLRLHALERVRVG